MSLSSRLAESLRDLGALEKGERYLLAASGGIDSSVLARLLADIARRWEGSLTLAHVHHGIRPDAGVDEQAASDLAQSLGCGFLQRTVDVPAAVSAAGGTVQDTARALRYRALEEMRAEAGARWIVTAHHADDQAETLLLRFLRGAGPSGLAGIRPKNGAVIRPLLFATREEIRAEGIASGVRWIEDSSNASDAYARNALRRNVIPVLGRLHPGFVRALSESGDVFRSLSEFLDAHAGRLAAHCMSADGETVSLAVQTVKEYFDFEQRLLIRQAILHVRNSEATHSETIAVQRLLDAPAGSAIPLGDGWSAFRDRGSIVFARPGGGFPERTIRVGEQAEIAAGRFESRAVATTDVRYSDDRSAEFIDLDACGEVWTLRQWRDGDWFQPIGFAHRKKLSDYFVDQGIPARVKASIPVLEGRGRIIWVCGHRLDDRSRITASTVRAALLRFTPNHAEPW